MTAVHCSQYTLYIAVVISYSHNLNEPVNRTHVSESHYITLPQCKHLFKSLILDCRKAWSA